MAVVPGAQAVRAWQVRSAHALRRDSGLGRELERLRRSYGPQHLRSDPVSLVHRYKRPADQEIVGWIAAMLAFGRVASVLRSVVEVLGRLGAHPGERARRARRSTLLRLLRGFRHRWIDGETLADALWVLGTLLRRHGTLEAAFAAHDGGETTVREMIARHAREARGLLRVPSSRAFSYLFPSPDQGSACKRVNLFLRWMVRPRDGVDLGLWTFCAPSRLIVPLDTHIAFLGRALGLTSRRTPGWLMAEDVTRALRGLDAGDPVKYDWSLSRLGILGCCPGRRDPRVSPACTLYTWCRL